MNTERDNVVNFDEWKTNRGDTSFSDYLKVLSFSDLMNESNELMDQINRNKEREDVFSKTRMLMNEFTMRLEKESRLLADSVKDLKKQIDEKI